jgi:Flp pilus assembly protein TadG
MRMSFGNPRGPERTERGAAAIELALVLPVVIAVMFGIIQYGVYFWGRSTAAASARESARQLAVGTRWDCSQAQAVSKANLAGKDVVVSRRYLNASNAPVVGDMVEVTITEKTLSPILLPIPDSGRITEVATARVENVPLVPVECS